MLTGEIPGHRIKAARIVAGVSPTRAAKWLGIRKCYLLKMESAHKWPSVKRMMQLSELYKTTVSRIIGEMDR